MCCVQVPYLGAMVSHFINSGNQGVFMALRRLFLLKNLFSSTFSYYSYVATTMEADLSDMLRMDWKNWLLATLAISLKSATIDMYVIFALCPSHTCRFRRF